MARYAMVIDTRRCVGCTDCVVACKTENNVPDGFTRDWVVEDLRGKFPDLQMEIRSERCHHCDNAPCVRSCPTGASHVGAGGSVQVDRNLCTGCKACIAACPYNARYVHPDGYVDKCTFCMPRVENGSLPACVSVCPTHCMHFGDLDDSLSSVTRLLQSRASKSLLPEAGTSPQVYYLT
jgi:Fe-S-cluster-containing dehydrogenase component